MRAITRVVTLAAASVVVLGGCNTGPSDDPNSLPTPQTSMPGTSPTASPTATQTLSPSQRDLRDAEQSIAAYWTVLDQAASDPKVNLNVLATVARSQALAQWQSTLSEYRAKKWTQTGAAEVLDAAATKRATAKFEVTACVDVSGVDVVDASGKSVVTAGRPARQQYTYQVEKAPQGFFVTVDTLKGKPCAA